MDLRNFEALLLSVIVVSDVHLGYEMCAKQNFMHFINSIISRCGSEHSYLNKIQHIILLGDILDFWRRDNETLLFENMKLLNRFGSVDNAARIHYVIGNHDYSLRKMIESEDMPFEFSEELQLTIADKGFRFIHGHQLESKSKIASSLYGKISHILCSSGDSLGERTSQWWDRLEPKIRTEIQGIDWNDLTSEELMEVANLKRVQDLGKRDLMKLVDFMFEDITERTGPCPILTEEWTDSRGFLSDGHLHAKAHATLKISERKTRQLSVEELRIRETAKRIVGLKEDEFLVFGHTHQAFLGDSVANPGCWLQDKTNSYLHISNNGRVDVLPWPYLF